MFVREGADRAPPDRLDAGRGAAHPGDAAQGGRRSGRGRRGRHHAVRVPETSAKDELGSAGTDPDGILNLAIRDVIAEVGDATVV